MSSSVGENNETRAGVPFSRLSDLRPVADLIDLRLHLSAICGSVKSFKWRIWLTSAIAIEYCAALILWRRAVAFCTPGMSVTPSCDLIDSLVTLWKLPWTRMALSWDKEFAGLFKVDSTCVLWPGSLEAFCFLHILASSAVTCMLTLWARRSRPRRALKPPHLGSTRNTDNWRSEHHHASLRVTEPLRCSLLPFSL